MVVITVLGLIVLNGLYYSFCWLPVTAWKHRAAVKRAALALWAVATHWLLRVWALTALAIWATFRWEWAYDLSSFTFALGKVSMLLTVGWIIDSQHFKAINTIELFKSEPKAYAIVLASLLAALA